MRYQQSISHFVELNVVRVRIWNHLKAFPSYFDLESVKCNVMESILVLLWYEAFWFVVGMQWNSINIISRHRINLRMFPDVTTCEIESIDMLVPSNQHWWVIVDTNTPHLLRTCDVAYQSYVIWIYTEIENII